MEPDVAPAGRGHRVAEPLMRELVGDQPLRVPATVAVIGPEGGETLCLDGDLEFVVGDHDGVLGERIRPEHLDERGHHLGLLTEIDPEVLLESRGDEARDRNRFGRQRDLLVLTDLDRRQVGGHRFHLLVDPGGLRGADPLGLQDAVGERVIRAVGGDRDPVRRLGARVVVAGEPRRRPVGLVRTERAVGQFLPTDLTPRAADRMRTAVVSDGDGHRPARGEWSVGGDGQLVPTMRIAGALVVDRHPLHRQRARQVEGETLELGIRRRGQDRGALEAVARHLVLEFQIVSRDAIAQIAVVGQICIEDVGGCPQHGLPGVAT